MATKSGFGVRLTLSVPFLLALVTLSAPVTAQQDQVQTARIRESNAREGWQRVPDILVALNVVPGARVADVGAGDGFFTVRLARAVGPNGRVIAEDINPAALDRLRARLVEELLSNVDVVQGEVADPRLPADSLDAILIVNAYHEMDQFAPMLDHFRKALKPRGRLVLVEPLDPRLRGESRDRQTKDHSLDAGFADRELRAAGFDIVGLRDPFIHRGDTEQWLIVAERAGDAGAASTAAATTAPRLASHGAVDFGTDAEIASPGLRISTTQLKTLLEAGQVLLLDVRDADSYLAGHIPGAILLPLGDLADRLSELRGQNKPVVAYCT